MLQDVKVLDATMHTSLDWMLKHDITDIIFETFTVEAGGKAIALCANGANIDVTEANKREYIRLLCEWKTIFSVADIMNPFLRGFHELVPPQQLRDAEIGWAELDLMLNGRPVLDVEEIRAYCIYQGGGVSSGVVGPPFGEGHRIIIWLWQLLREYSEEERRLLLLFFTGCSRVPLDGFDPALNITEGVDMDDDSLPRAHTCFNQLVLPNYTSFAMMRDRVTFAINNTEGFGLA